MEVGPALPIKIGSRSLLLRGWRAEVVIVLAVLVAATSLFYYEVVFLGRTLVPVHLIGVMGPSGPYGYSGVFRGDPYRVDTGASGWAMEPWTRKVSAEYTAGRLPLWNEHQGFGSPLLANAQSGAMDILRLPALLSGSSLAWDIYYLLRTVLGGMAAYAFARSIRLAIPAGLFLALAYVFAGHFLFLGNNMWVEAYFLMPIVLLGTELIIGGRSRLGFATTAISIALNLYVGMPEVTLFVLLMAASHAGWRLIGLAREPVGFPCWARRCTLLIGAWATGVVLAAPFLLTLFEFVTSSPKMATGRGLLGTYTEPLTNAVVWFIPFLNGRPLDPTYASYICNYVGTTVLVFALYGLQPTRTRLYWQIVPFAFLVPALLLAKTFGVPLVNEIGRLPLFNVSVIPKWSAPVIGFGLALLAAVGVHRLVTDKPNLPAAARAIVIFLWLTIVALLLDWEKASQASSPRLWGTIGIALLFATAFWVLVELHRWIRPAVIGLVCCVVVTMELFIYAPVGVYQNRYDRFAEPPFVQYLASQHAHGPFRIFGLDGLLFPNSSSVFGLDDIRSLDALYIDRYLLYVQNFLSPGVSDRYVGYLPASSEKETRLAGNPWFDLTGVRYVVAKLGTSSPNSDNPLGKEFLAANPDRPQNVLNVQPFTIDGVTKSVLFEHPPAGVGLPLTVTPDRSVLQFSLAVDPKVWDPSKGDGVGFDIFVEIGGKREKIYRRDVNAKQDPSQRHWLDDRVDLSRFLGQDIVLVLGTDPLSNPLYDWVGWGDLRLTSEDAATNPQYTKVYENEVQIFENRHALPRAFLINTIVPVTDRGAATSAMKGAQVDPAHAAIVEGVSPDQAAAVGPGGGTATIRSYVSTDVAIDVDANAESFLVLTDSFYPGWIATVDGHEVPIYATDLAFRGVFVPWGQHTVRFSYRPTSFSLGLALAAGALFVLFVVATGYAPWRRWIRRRATLQTSLPATDESSMQPQGVLAKR